MKRSIIIAISLLFATALLFGCLASPLAPAPTPTPVSSPSPTAGEISWTGGEDEGTQPPPIPE